MIPVQDTFHAAAAGQVIRPITNFYASFDKSKSDEIDFFTLDQSILDGDDILASTEESPIQNWDTYNYIDYSDFLVSANLSRSFEFPYAVQSAMLDVTLDNTLGYFTPDGTSPIAPYNLPQRPVRLYAGFQGQSMLSQFIGLTQDMPEIDNEARTAGYHALDFLSQIAAQQLTDVVDMRDARTDEVLAAIVEQFGVLPSQYNFEPGANTIPFVFFDVGADAGEAIRKLVQAENGRFWMDETGVLRFQARNSHRDEVALNLPQYSIMNITPSGTDGMVNHVIIKADIREVQEFQVVYTKTAAKPGTTNTGWVIPANSTLSISASLEDPCYSVVTPTLGKSSSVSWFTAVDATFEQVETGITATGSLTTNSFDLVFTNTNAYAVEIDEMQLFGEPAKVVNVLDYEAYEDESVEKYGEHILEITDNQFFQSLDQAESYAAYMLYDRAFYNTQLEVSIKGDFSLQLGDVISLQDDEFGGAYVVDSIEYNIEPGILETTLMVHKFVSTNYFTLDESVLDGNDILI